MLVKGPTGGAKTGIFREHENNNMAVDALASCVTSNRGIDVVGLSGACYHRKMVAAAILEKLMYYFCSLQIFSANSAIAWMHHAFPIGLVVLAVFASTVIHIMFSGLSQ